MGSATCGKDNWQERMTGKPKGWPAGTDDNREAADSEDCPRDGGDGWRRSLSAGRNMRTSLRELLISSCEEPQHNPWLQLNKKSNCYYPHQLHTELL